jgi:hypothetical protein
MKAKNLAAILPMTTLMERLDLLMEILLLPFTRKIFKTLRSTRF